MGRLRVGREPGTIRAEVVLPADAAVTQADVIELGVDLELDLPAVA